MIVIPNWILTALACLMLAAGGALIFSIAVAALAMTWRHLLHTGKNARVLWFATAQKLHGDQANRELFWRALYSQAERSDAWALEIAEQALQCRGLQSREDWTDLRVRIHHHRWGDALYVHASADACPSGSPGAGSADQR